MRRLWNHCFRNSKLKPSLIIDKQLETHNPVTLCSLKGKPYVIRHMPMNSIDISNINKDTPQRLWSHHHIFYKNDENTMEEAGIGYCKHSRIFQLKLNDPEETKNRSTSLDLTEENRILEPNPYMESVVDYVNSNVHQKYHLGRSDCQSYVSSINKEWSKRTAFNHYKVKNERLIDITTKRPITGEIVFYEDKEHTKLILKGQLIDGKLHGKVEQFYPSYLLYEKMEYVNGTKHKDDDILYSDLDSLTPANSNYRIENKRIIHSNSNKPFTGAVQFFYDSAKTKLALESTVTRGILDSERTVYNYVKNTRTVYNLNNGTIENVRTHPLLDVDSCLLPEHEKIDNTIIDKNTTIPLSAWYKYYNADNVNLPLLEGNVVNGKLEGPVFEYNSTNNSYTLYDYKNGWRTKTISIITIDNNSMYTHSSMTPEYMIKNTICIDKKTGKLANACVHYTNEKNIFCVGNFKNGLLNGNALQYDSKQNIITRYWYKDGKEQYTISSHPIFTSNIFDKANFTIDNNIVMDTTTNVPAEGPFILYEDTEKTIPVLKGTLKNGKLHGKVTMHDYEICITTEHKYEHGKKVLPDGTFESNPKYPDNLENYTIIDNRFFNKITGEQESNIVDCYYINGPRAFDGCVDEEGRLHGKVNEYNYALHRKIETLYTNGKPKEEAFSIIITEFDPKQDMSRIQNKIINERKSRNNIEGTLHCYYDKEGTKLSLEGTIQNGKLQDTVKVYTYTDDGNVAITEQKYKNGRFFLSTPV